MRSLGNKISKRRNWENYIGNWWWCQWCWNDSRSRYWCWYQWMWRNAGWSKISVACTTLCMYEFAEVVSWNYDIFLLFWCYWIILWAEITPISLFMFLFITKWNLTLLTNFRLCPRLQICFFFPKINRKIINLWLHTNLNVVHVQGSQILSLERLSASGLI